MRLKAVHLLIFSLLCHSVSFAQDCLNHKLFTTDNGLPFNQVECITMDHTGFLWIATWDGLSRYDGYEFRNYYHKSNDTASFPFFSLDKVVVDKYNYLWVFSERKTPVYYNRRTDSFTRLKSGSKSDLAISDIALGPDGLIWFTSGMSLGKYDSDKKKIHFYRIHSEPNFRIGSDLAGFQLVFDNRHGIWFYYTSDYEYHILKGTILDDSTVLIRNFGSIPFLNNRSFSLHNTTGNIDIFISSSDKTWIFSRYGLYKYDPVRMEIVKSNIDPPREEFTGKKYYVWTEDETGIHVIDTRRKCILNIKPEDNEYFETVFVDSSGIIWSGTIDPQNKKTGLNQHVFAPAYFRNYLVGNTETKASNMVYTILKDRNNDIWVRSKNKKNLVAIHPDNTETEIKLDDDYSTERHTRVMSLAEDTAGIWIGTDKQIWYYDYSTRETSLFTPEANGISPASLGMHNILNSKDGPIVNGSIGVYRYDVKTNKIIMGYKHEPTGTGFTLVHDSLDGYWLGSYSSTIIHLNKNMECTGKYKIGNENNIIEHICTGDSNDVWVAIMGEGLGHLYLRTGKTEIFAADRGLDNNVLSGVLKDHHGKLWVSNNRGISRFDPGTREFSNFGKNEGLLISEFGSDSYCISHDGEFLFGGIGGFAGFYPDSIETMKLSSNINLIITDFKVSGLPRYFNKPVYELDSIVLNKGDNNFQATFACLNLRNPEKIKYRYRLVGENNRWTESDFRTRTLSFAQLSHNKYKLEIEATDETGQWTYSKSILIIIPPYITETILFKTILASLIFLVIFLLIFIYIRQIRLKAIQTQNRLKLDSLKGQMNPHFIFNSLNSINYFILNEDKLAANDYIADFSRLIRSFLENISNDYIYFDNELEVIRDYLKLEHLRFGDKFDYILNADNVKFEHELYVMPGLVQPFIENAIWHGVRGLENRKGRIFIEFKTTYPDRLQCIIEDDGVGRKQTGLSENTIPGKRSLGIKIVLDRLAIINNQSQRKYNVTIEDAYPDDLETGTRVTIDLPIRVA
jgi:ligand-binding sensor domain-containing protein